MKKLKQQSAGSAITPQRKEALWRLAIIAVAILVILLFRNSTGPERYIVAVVFIIGLYQFLKIIALAPLLFYSSSSKVITEGMNILLEGNPPSLSTKIIYQGGGLVFFLGLLGTALQATPLGNTVNGAKFFWICFALGLLPYTLLILFFKLLFPAVFEVGYRRFVVYVGYLLGFCLIAPSLASFINIHCAGADAGCKTYRINSKFESSDRRAGKVYYLHIDINGKEERFEVTKSFYGELGSDGYVDLCLQQGKLGYDFVKGFQLRRAGRKPLVVAILFRLLDQLHITYSFICLLCKDCYI